MIKKIKEINNFGIFEDFRIDTAVKEFSKFNLFYGWNGSGKTTLSRLFRKIENYKESDALFPDASFRVDCESGVIDEKYSNVPPLVRVFNKDFVSEHTNLEKGKTNSLLFLGKDKDLLNKEIKRIDTIIFGEDGKGGKSQDLVVRQANYTESINKKDAFFRDSATQLKEMSLSTIFPDINANKRTSEAIWNQLCEKASLDDILLSDTEYTDRIAFIAQGNRKENILFQHKKIDVDSFDLLYSEIDTLLKENPVINSINRLSKFTDISAWVQQGITLHKKHNSLRCEYCNSIVTPERTADLTSHFNEAFKDLQAKIVRLIIRLENYKLSGISIQEDKWFPELKDKGIIALKTIDQRKTIINEAIDVWIQILTEKKGNPTQVAFSISTIGRAENLNVYNSAFEDLSILIERQKLFYDEFDTKSKQSNQEIRNHIIAKRALLSNFQDLLVSLAELKSETRKLKNDISDLNKKIGEYKLQLLDDNLAIEEINNDLSRFLTSNSFVLDKNKTGEGGYLIKRRGKIAKNLSEGEKTAIALCFFMAKLKEEGNDIKKNIIVFDDPISSLDSNHLFSACTYITNRCEDAKQVFFLTHNFWFFKLLRDWIQRKNGKKNSSSVGNLYTIKNGDIANAENALIRFHSEYHFIFNSLYQFKNKDLSLAESYSIANFSRRLLESFNSFKTQQVKGFDNILQKANKVGISKDETGKLFYFLNKYSHLDRIENFENTIENTEGEAKSVIEITLRIIEKIDEEHYNSMIKVCRK